MSSSYILSKRRAMTEFPSIKDKTFLTVLCFNQAA